MEGTSRKKIMFGFHITKFPVPQCQNLTKFSGTSSAYKKFHQNEFAIYVVINLQNPEFLTLKQVQDVDWILQKSSSKTAEGVL